MKLFVAGATLTAVMALTPRLDAQQHSMPPGAQGQAAHAVGAMAPPMAAHMHTMDSLGARLDTAVARMNRAAGDARTAAMQDVLRELVAAHKEMHAHMSQMASQHAMGDSAGMQPRIPRTMPGAARPDSAARPRR
jgi:hypothetical protein